MADYTLIQSGDADAAENVGAVVGLLDSGVGGWIVSGLGLTGYDATAEEIDVNAGKSAHILDTALAEWTLDDGTQKSETRHDVLIVSHLDARTNIALATDDVNHVFVEPNWGTDDSPTIETNTTDSLPSADAVKIGEVDTANDVVSSQWNLARYGTVTFPDEAAIDSEDAQNRLPEGTNVYDRATDNQYVITG